MFKADTLRRTDRMSSVYFAFATTFLVMASVSSSLFLAISLGFIVAGLVTRRSKQDIVIGATLFALVVVAFGYGVGKDVAGRDSARTASVSADGA